MLSALDDESRFERFEDSAVIGTLELPQEIQGCREVIHGALVPTRRSECETLASGQGVLRELRDDSRLGEDPRCLFWN